MDLYMCNLEKHTQKCFPNYILEFFTSGKNLSPFINYDADRETQIISQQCSY